MALIVAGGAADRSPSHALIAFARSLSAAGFLPGRLPLRRIIRRDLLGTFRPAPERWVSNDESCFAEVTAVEPRRPLTKITFGCRFTASADAAAFLREAATALGGPMVPPLAENIPRELHHRASITAGARLIGVELHVIPDDTTSLATVVLTDGARIVIGGTVFAGPRVCSMLPPCERSPRFFSSPPRLSWPSRPRRRQAPRRKTLRRSSSTTSQSSP